MTQYIVGTAGHIDHGKTELIRALTGVHTDRLPEEQARGITIDLGFASMDLRPGVHLAFIDVPGHERFVKNMLAGVAGIDLVLLVVAADESVMPQTREHFEICSLLGVRRGVVALTKIDLVSSDLRELAELEIREYLEGSFLEAAPVVPVSARTGEGIDDLREALAGVTDGLPPKEAGGWVRLPVDRSFSIRGFGTVVTGTLFSGTLRTGDEMKIYPEGLSVRVRRLEVHGAETAEAVAGNRVAANLQGVDVPQIGRGDWLASPGSLRPAHRVDVRLHLLESAPAMLKDLARVRYHHGAAEVLARVKLLGSRSIQPGEDALAQLRLEGVDVALPGDRFILRRYSPVRTIGGGTVLDPDPDKHRGAAPVTVDRLTRLEAAPAEDQLVLTVENGGRHGVPSGELPARLGLSSDALGEALRRAEQDGRVVTVGEGERTRVLTCATIRELRDRVVRQLEEFHAERPLEPGLGKEELRVRLFRGAPVELFRHVLVDLTEGGEIRVEGDRVRQASHQPRLSEDEQRARQSIEDRFRAAGLNPPGLEQVAREEKIPSDRATVLYHVLVREGALVRLRGGLTIHRESLQALIDRLLQFRNHNETIDIAAFKELSGTTRKTAIPLLEYLDAAHVTARRGSERVILPPTTRAVPPGESRSGVEREK